MVRMNGKWRLVSLVVGLALLAACAPAPAPGGPTATVSPLPASVTPPATPQPPTSQPGGQPERQRITFAPGAISASVQGTLPASGSASYVLAAQGGQWLTAQVDVSSGEALLIVWGADGNVLQSDHAGSPTYVGQLPSSQDYNLDVRAGPNAPVQYTLTVTVPPAGEVAPITRRITFSPGAITAVVQSTLPTSDTERWVVNAQAGQTLNAQLSFTTGEAILIVFGADGNVLQSDHAGSPAYNGRLPTAQDYNLDVHAGPDAPVQYTLTVTIPPAP